MSCLLFVLKSSFSSRASQRFLSRACRDGASIEGGVSAGRRLWVEPGRSADATATDCLNFARIDSRFLSGLKGVRASRPPSSSEKGAGSAPALQAKNAWLLRDEED
jgi:hypothetical protein